MERIVFLIPPDDQQLFCMLNPESVEIHRSSGVTSQPMIGSATSCRDQVPGSLLYNGSQTTIIDLRLLFDTTIYSDSTTRQENVRLTTRRLFELAGPSAGLNGNALSIVRMIWGKSWSVPGIIMEIAERLDYFNEYGEARRSWVALRLLVVEDVHELPDKIEPAVVQELISPQVLTQIASAKNSTEELKNERSVLFNDRLDSIAYKMYGSPGLWRVLAEYNDIDSIAPPAHGNSTIKIPSMETLMREKRNV